MNIILKTFDMLIEPNAKGDTIKQSKILYDTFSKSSFFDFLKRNKNIITENGLNRIYYNEGKGDLFQEFHMSNGKKNGLFVDYYPTNIMSGITVRKQVVNFKNNLEDGSYKQYFGSLPKDWLIIECNYKDGLLDGNYKSYAAYVNCCLSNNGMRYLKGDYNYLNGKKHGWCCSYLLSRPGEIYSKVEYDNGKKIGDR